MAELNYGQFFKVMMPGFKKRLSIPKAFCRYLDEDVDEGLVRSCLGSWPVRVARNRDGSFSFEEGWEHFVKCHRLKEIDFLVFKHRGGMVFDVMVYDHNGAEKDFPPPANLAANRLSESHVTCNESSASRHNPSFDIMMSETHRSIGNSYLTVPVAFVRSYGLGGRTDVILRRAGKLWAVELGTWKGSAEGETLSVRTAIRTKGWCKFYKDNKLKDGDLCTFELQKVPKSRSTPLIMDVQITRQRA